MWVTNIRKPWLAPLPPTCFLFPSPFPPPSRSLPILLLAFPFPFHFLSLPFLLLSFPPLLQSRDFSYLAFPLFPLLCSVTFPRRFAPFLLPLAPLLCPRHAFRCNQTSNFQQPFYSVSPAGPWITQKVRRAQTSRMPVPPHHIPPETRPPHPPSECR